MKGKVKMKFGCIVQLRGWMGAADDGDALTVVGSGSRAALSSSELGERPESAPEGFARAARNRVFP